MTLQNNKTRKKNKKAAATKDNTPTGRVPSSRDRVSLVSDLATNRDFSLKFLVRLTAFNKAAPCSARVLAQCAKVLMSKGTRQPRTPRALTALDWVSNETGNTAGPLCLSSSRWHSSVSLSLPPAASRCFGPTRARRPLAFRIRTTHALLLCMCTRFALWCDEKNFETAAAVCTWWEP